ncbi:hypothetical protein ACFLV4_01280 [Chloroflexota bacterium]
MDTVLRAIAVFIEVALLAGIAYCVLNGVRLTIFDLGAGSKYNKALTMALVAVGVIVAVFFIAHLITFYPTI